jgi:hypothetical protein
MYQHKKEDPSDPFAMLSGGELPDDFPDWNNPEDQDDDAPEGYYDEEDDDDDDSYVPGPDDPDYDLSEAAGYAGWEDTGDGIPQWLIATISVILILAIAVPAILVLR